MIISKLYYIVPTLKFLAEVEMTMTNTFVQEGLPNLAFIHLSQDHMDRDKFAIHLSIYSMFNSNLLVFMLVQHYYLQEWGIDPPPSGLHHSD